jgi:hypothetical protein
MVSLKSGLPANVLPVPQGAGVFGKSGSHWGVIKASAVALPSIGMEVGDWSRQAHVLVRRSPVPPSMHAMLIEICLEIEQLVF